MPSEDDNIVDFVVEVLKVKQDVEIEMGDEEQLEEVDEDEDDNVKYCVVLRKKRGPKQDFIKIFKNFRFFCKKLNNIE